MAVEQPSGPGPHVFYPRPFLIVSTQQRHCEWIARQMEFDRADWRPVCSSRDATGYRVRAAFFDEPRFCEEPQWREMAAALVHAARNHVHIDAVALDFFRARTRSQALQAAEASKGARAVAVPYGSEYANAGNWGQPTMTVNGVIVELERYAPHGSVVEATASIAIPGGHRARITTRRLAAIEELTVGFREQTDGPWVFLTHEVEQLDQWRAPVTFDEPGVPSIWEHWQDQQRLESTRQQLRRATGDPEAAQQVMAAALELSRTSGTAIWDAIAAVNQAGQTNTAATTGENRSELIAEIRRAIREGQRKATKRPASRAKLKAEFGPRQRKIDLEE